MRELRAASAFANRPDAGGSGLQAVVDLDKAARVQWDSSRVEANIRRIRDPADRHQQMTAFDLPFSRRRPDRYRSFCPAATAKLCVNLHLARERAPI
jgi:hypothetical protein